VVVRKSSAALPLDPTEEFDGYTFLGLPEGVHPMLVEGLLFALICFIITALSLSLDEEGSDGALSYYS